MISTLGVIIIVVGASVSVLIVGAISIVLILRANDRRHRNNEEIARQFSAGQRVRLSASSNNYSHVPEPRANLRRSTHLPFGVVSEGWETISSQESLAQYQKTFVNGPPDPVDALMQQKRRRSLRASFSAHSFSLPKTRRQKKIEKAIPLRSMPRSPLSAITEQSGTNTSEASPSIGIAELPTKITPKTTPDRGEDALHMRRRVSPQWPLTSIRRVSTNGAPTIKTVPAGQNSSVMRTNSSDHSFPPLQSSIGQRSISIVSTLSIAPEDPLPPLPSVTPSQYPTRRRSRLRLSAASDDTIGSSVLGGRTSPSQTDTDLTSIGLGTPLIDLDPKGVQAYDREIQDWELATVITTGSPKARHATKNRSGKAVYGSLTASIGNHSSSQSTKREQIADPRDCNSLISRPFDSVLTTVESNKWKPDLSSRANSVRSSVSPSFAATMTCTGPGYQKGKVTARHSMYEQHSSIGRFTTNSAAFSDLSGNRTSPNRRPASSRPASVASENPFHWDRNSLQTGLSSSLKSSPGSQRKGHKRQNCVRISNIPAVDTTRRASKLPQMTEEEEDPAEATTSKTTTIPGLNLLEHQKQGGNASTKQEHITPSPFVTRPILEPTSWKRPKYSRARSSESIESCKRESDVFSNSRYDPSAPNIFTDNSTARRQWPLSPTTPYRAKVQHTPPSLRTIQEPCDLDSPTLPMPAISSATLFAHALPLGPRVSGVQGPRNITISSRSSQTTSPSPMTARTGAKREDLRRSVVKLRRMNSDAKDKTRISQIYRNIGNESTTSLLDAKKESEEDPTATSIVSGAGDSTEIRSPNSPGTKLQVPSTRDERVSISPFVESTLTVSGLRFSKSRSKIGPSPSTMSAGATSIWEDASVRGSPEPELLKASQIPSSQLVDVEAYENFIGQDKRSEKDKDRESRLTSPQGRGLGLMGVQMQGKVWGTPGSLYDREGFLKE